MFEKIKEMWMLFKMAFCLGRDWARNGKGKKRV